MFKFMTSLRAALLLGKANKQLETGRYRDALGRALKAQSLDLEPQFEWLACSIEGKARYHLGDAAGALPVLQKAEKILQPILEQKRESTHLQNIVSDIRSYIERIDSEAA